MIENYTSEKREGRKFSFLLLNLSDISMTLIKSLCTLPRNWADTHILKVGGKNTKAALAMFIVICSFNKWPIYITVLF